MENFWDLTEYTAFAVEFRYGSLELSEELKIGHKINPSLDDSL